MYPRVDQYFVTNTKTAAFINDSETLWEIWTDYFQQSKITNIQSWCETLFVVIVSTDKKLNFNHI